ncbi:MAG: 23S rRNA (uracil(1939)-C(5))-methyltransferase RlmD [bacterium]
MLKVGDPVTVEIESLAYGGDGVARRGGLAVFVPHTAPGDVVEVEITERHKAYARGRVLSLINPSPERVPPPCPHFQECGGCQLQHIAYMAQLLHKQRFVKDALERIGHLPDVEVHPTVGVDKIYNYRNKAQQPVGRRGGRIISGFYAPRTHDIVAIESCMVQPEAVNRIIATARRLIEESGIKAYDEVHHSGNLRHIVVRWSWAMRAALVGFVTLRRYLPKSQRISQTIMEENPEVVGVVQNINGKPGNAVMGEESRLLRGIERIVEVIRGLQFEISLGTFMQVNTEGCEKLYDIVLEYSSVDGKSRALDLYCGVGTISLLLARRAGEVWGVESEGESIKRARKNASRNCIRNCTFIQGRVEESLGRLEGRFDVVVMDPPRRGCDPAVLEWLASHSPPRVVYVSCDPATLARDLSRLSGVGYRVAEVQPVDLFPQTYHVESVARLERK